MPNIRSTRFIRATGVVMGVFLALVVGGVASSSAAGELVVELTGSPVANGANATLTVDITNNDANGAGGVPATKLTLPSGVTYVSASSGVTCTPGTGSVSCTHGTVPGNGGTDTFDVIVKPDHTAIGTIDASAAYGSLASNTDSVDIVAEADLGVTASVSQSSGLVAGQDGFDFTAEVANGGPSDSGSGTVTITLPSDDLAFGDLSTSGCEPVEGNALQVACDAGNVAPGGTPSFTVPVDVLHQALGHYDVTADVSSTTPQPSDATLANTDTAGVDVIAKADLGIVGSVLRSPALVCANYSPDPPPATVCPDGGAVNNTVQFTITFSSTGPSDARNSTLKFDPSLSSLLGAADWCQRVGGVLCLPSDTFTPYNASTGIPAGTLVPLVDGGSSVTFVVRARALLEDQIGPLTVSQGFVVSSDATEIGSSNNHATAPATEIDTVPYPVQGVQAIPGNGNAIVTWTAQPASRNGGQPITSYRITVKPPANGTLYYDLPVAGATKVRCPNDPSNTPNCYQRTIPSLANDQASPYTFEVRANNAVGFSLLDLATGGSTAKATPSLEAVAQLVPNATAQTLTTCTIATSEHRTCVQYVVPSGTGGVFGAQGGASVGLPTSFCNGACIGSTGAQNLGALAGYDDRTKPLVEIINWDSTTIPSSLAKQPVCATNSTATNCFPNNLPIYYETSAFLALNDLRGATFLNAPSGPHGPYVTHFCSLPTNRGGAGNVNYARPKPSGGYTDTAGSACIKSISVLTGLPSLRPDDKGDVRLVLNLTSDSDALAGHR